MSASARDLLRRVQEDAYGRLLAEPQLATVALVLERKAVTPAELQRILSARGARGGKVGLCILVQRPVFNPGADDSSLRGQLVQAFTIIEHPALNAGDLGDGRSAEEIAADVLQLFAFAACTVPGQAFSPFAGGAVVSDNSFEGFNAWEVRLQLFGAIARDARCGTPLIDPDSGSHAGPITLTTATAGAGIYYTTDGTYPSSESSTAHLYSAPLTLAAACTLRTAAEKAGLQQSQISEATFT